MTSNHKAARFSWRAIIAACAGPLLILGAASPQTASAQNYNVLYTFTGGVDGSAPLAGVTGDAQGNLYGTTYAGGANGDGVVFKLDPSGNETVLHCFTGGADGGYPYADLIRDAQGNLYGTTQQGGASGSNRFGTTGFGVVFKLDSGGNYSVFYTFTGGADGAYPQASLTRDAQGNLYGTTNDGGAFKRGVVFKLSPSGNETVLHSFTGGADGLGPAAGLIQDAQGNLYGTTVNGGAIGYGVVFKLDPSGNATVLHSFTDGADGAIPYAGLIQDAQGNLYGSTYVGGVNGGGVVFKLDPSGNETVLHSFTGGADGAYPKSTLIQDAQGNLFGTALGGGTYSAGTVFELDSAGNLIVLYNFTGGADGAGPNADLFMDAQGNLNGVTANGGIADNGVVFKTPDVGLSSVSINLDPVTGGNACIGTVTLSGSAPTGGFVVHLSSGDTSVATVPATITIPAGQTSASFPISTTKVKVETPVAISASENGASQASTLTVTPIALESVSVKPTSVIGGSSVIGTVTLTKAAPTGGAVVTLSSSNPAIVSVPTSITIPSGQKKATFTVMTSSVSSTTKETITASYGGTLKIANLKVKK